MALNHLKQRDDAPKGRLTFTILEKPGIAFDPEFARAIQQSPALAALNPEVRGSILEIDAQDNDSVAHTLDELVGRAIELVLREREMAAHLRQIEESQRFDAHQRFKDKDGL